MSQQQRQQNLFGIQDWQNIYTTFRDSDFKSYDYETLRKSMVDFLRLYNPENFNDYINSSEYIALIDLIAFMGQSLSFRMDLNARENYLPTARRRDSVLRLAQMVNYLVKRNIASQGLLKVESVSTNEVLHDVYGNSLTNSAINWNDANNSRWQEQWNTVLNSSITSSQRVGRPGNSALISGIQTSEYSIDIPSTSSAPYRFTSTVDNSSMTFEVINPDITSGVIIDEYGHAVNTIFNLLYRDDAQGYASNNTGYFLKFKQGTLVSENIAIIESLPSRQVDLSATGVNNVDIWLYQINSDGTLTQWTKVDAVSGTTVSYNSEIINNKKVFSVTSRADDAITLSFGDGVFSEIPIGNFVAYYRVSNGTNYRINPSEMNRISISVPYISKNNRVQTLTLIASLKYTVANSATKESLTDIKLKAPQNYYTQNRMVNGQDYNSLPFTRYNNILKIKSVNRTSSGISRYLDVIDVTGRYSSTNIVCDDGYIYNDPKTLNSTFSYSTSNYVNDVVAAVNSLVANDLTSDSILAFFLKNYSITTQASGTAAVTWKLVQQDNDVCNGFVQSQGNTLAITDNRFANKFRIGAILRFDAPPSKIFDYNNRLVVHENTDPILANQKASIYVTIRDFTNFGLGDRVGSSSSLGYNTDGTGAIVLSQLIPSGAVLGAILPTYTPLLPADIQRALINILLTGRNAGLYYIAGSDAITQTGTWVAKDLSYTIPDETVPFVEPTNTLMPDQSWLLAFRAAGNNSYELIQRSVAYYFGSLKQTRFFFDPNIKIYDPANGKLLKDQITVLKTNAQPVLTANQGYPADIVMGISGTVTESAGFVDDAKIQITFADSNSDGSPDQPYFYQDVTGNIDTAGVQNSYVFFKDDQENSGSNFLALAPGVIKIAATKTDILNTIHEYSINDVVYVTDGTDTNHFYRVLPVSGILTVADSMIDPTLSLYSVREGRYNLKFQYQHNTSSDRRIDPSPSNIIDVYVLEKNYATDYMAWITDNTGTLVEPMPPTTETLRNDFSDLEQYRMISDLLIYNPVTFKPIYGSRADASLRATFAVVKNPQIVISDSEVKSQVIAKINEYFNVDNWDFGETVYFSELAAFLHTELNAILSSVHLVPVSADQKYGDLQQIVSLHYEIPVSAATVQDVEVVTNLTSQTLRVGN